MTSTQTPAIEREIKIEARPETIFPFFTDPERMSRWLTGSATLDPQPGGVFSAVIAGSHQASGTYLEIDPPRRVVFTFGWEGEGSVVPPGSSRIEVVLIPAGNETIVRFRHLGLPEITRADHTSGWEHYLARLVIAAQGGDPGPDPQAQPARQAV